MDPSRPAYPVREVSYFAAQAYCEYLERKHPDYIFRLPSEAEWEWAASLNSSDSTKIRASRQELRPVRSGDPGHMGLQFMEGNLWEWCSDWYAPGAYIFETSNEFDGAERCVRGGSFVNPEDSVTVSTRGSQPPSWCTPYLGFRVVAQKKE